MVRRNRNVGNRRNVKSRSAPSRPASRTPANVRRRAEGTASRPAVQARRPAIRSASNTRPAANLLQRPMTRGRFLRNVGVGAAVGAAALAGRSRVAHAASTSVPPGGDIQAAVDAASNGDTIVLQAGTHTIQGSVYVSKGLAIEGEVDNNGNLLTTVSGGGGTGFPDQNDPDPVGSDRSGAFKVYAPGEFVAFRKLHFDSQKMTSIWFRACNGSEVSDCEFTNLIQLANGSWEVSAVYIEYGGTFDWVTNQITGNHLVDNMTAELNAPLTGVNMFVSAENILSEANLVVQNSHWTGHGRVMAAFNSSGKANQNTNTYWNCPNVLFEVRNNVINIPDGVEEVYGIKFYTPKCIADGNNVFINANAGRCIAFHPSTQGPQNVAEVTNNTFSSNCGILNTFIVAPNAVCLNNRYIGREENGSRPGSAIYVYYNAPNANVSNNTIEGSYNYERILCWFSDNSVFAKNSITSVGPVTSPYAYGIGLDNSNGCTIDGNTIDMDAFYAINLLYSSNATIKANKIRGTYKHALELTGSSNNTFLGNNIVNVDVYYPDKPVCTPDNLGAALTDPYMTTAAGKYGQALDFTGVDFIETPSNSIPWTSNFTIAAWINPSSVGENQIWSWGGNNNTAEFRMSTNGYLEYGEWDGSSWRANYSTSLLPVNTWTHVAVVKTGTMSQLYVNGVPEGAPFNHVNTSLTVDPFVLVGARVGANGSSYDERWKGLLDDVMITSTSLTDAQVWNLFNLRTIPTTGLVAHYACDSADLYEEGTLQKIMDKSGNGHDGTINPANCPYIYEPCLIHLGYKSHNNTVNGYSGGNVVDVPDYNTITWTWVPGVGSIPIYQVGSAGYYNNDPAKPNAYEWSQEYFGYYGVEDGSWYYDYFRVPVDLLEDGKQNYITGFEPMAGAGGIGQYVSSSVSNEYKQWQAAFSSWFNAWLETHSNATDNELNEALNAYQAANPVPPKYAELE